MAIESREDGLARLPRHHANMRIRIIRIAHYTCPNPVYLCARVLPTAIRPLHVPFVKVFRGIDQDTVIDIPVPLFPERFELCLSAPNDDATLGIRYERVLSSVLWM